MLGMATAPLLKPNPLGTPAPRASLGAGFDRTVPPMFVSCSIYRFGALPSLKFLATENIDRVTVSIFDHRRQLEAHNFETVQRINKRISDVSSRINALQNGAKPGAIAPGDFSASYN